jgi:crotonobetainyl-CoA:carnitine CoA-transferase CaiB-like acyl-CoA transferase
MPSQPDSGPLLDGLRVLEVGEPLAVAVAGRLFAELGAEVLQVRPPAGERSPESRESRLAREVIDLLKREVEPGRLETLAAEADLILVGGRPADLEARGWGPEALHARYPAAVVASVTPFGLVGPHRDWRGGDLVAFHASGVAKLLLGPVDDAEAEPPVRAAGEQSEFIAGVVAGCAAMQALYRRQRTGEGALIDVSTQEALAILPAREHSMPGYGMLSLSRQKRADVLGAAYVLPAADGYVAVSPREEHQWREWVALMGSPAWASDPRYATHAERLQRADELVPHMASWTSQQPKAELAAAAQAVHVPCFAMNGPLDILKEPQLAARRHFVELPGSPGVQVPRRLFGLADGDYRDAAPPDAAFSPRPREATRANGGGSPLPLDGIRVLDLSWVIAGPTTTRYLAALGADVVKVEAPSRPDPGHRSELHAVLGRTKRDVALDLKAPGALDVLRRLVAESDIVVENFATGATERLGLGYDDLRAIREDIVMLSASGLGRTGPDAGHVAYGTLVQCFAGFADLNGYAGRPPVTGFAWSDPLLGLLLPFAATAALHARDDGRGGRRVDLSMAEALLWTMPGTLLEVQRDGAVPRRLGNTSRDFWPHDVFRAAGEDEWIAIGVTSDGEWRALCGVIDALEGHAGLTVEGRRAQAAALGGAIAAWVRKRDAREGAARLQGAGVPASASLNATQLFEDDHLWTRGFYESVLGDDGEARAMVGLPWRWAGATQPSTAAPRLGADTVEVLRDLGGLSDGEIEALERVGAFGAAGSTAAS